MRQLRKVLLLILVINLYSQNLISQDLLKIGDNLYSYFKTHPPKYSSSPYTVNIWKESEIKFYSYTKENDGTKPYILYTDGGKFLIGVLQGKSPNACYLFDTDGDMKLDFKTDNWFIPFWVIAVKSKTDSESNTVPDLMTDMYDSFNSNEGIANPKYTSAFMKETEYYKDTTLVNRDLIYLLYLYSNNVSNTDIALNSISLLESKYFERFDKVNPLIYLFKAETFLNLNLPDEAKTYFEKLLFLDPNSIVGKFYELKLEKDSTKIFEKEKYLKTNFPNHWMVKKL
jgi:hypothetical protein